MSWEVRQADCVEAMREMDEASVDAIVTDPPYFLGFMGKAWDTLTPGEVQHGHDRWATEALRVLKPGGHLLAAGGTRTFHRLVAAIEDAGFEIRDCIAHMYGSGFPKSHNGEWGGTALKPGFEPWTLARKPLIGTVEENWKRFGTGALNIDGCRVEASVGDREDYGLDGDEAAGIGYHGLEGRTAYERPVAGRWPANCLLGHSPTCGYSSGQLLRMDAWENGESLCDSCAEGAVSNPRPTAPAIRGSIAPNRVEPTTSERDGTLPDAIDKTDIGFSSGPSQEEPNGSQSDAMSLNTAESGGSTTDGRSPRATSSTTSTGTDSITESRTCSSCGALTTSPSTARSDKCSPDCPVAMLDEQSGERPSRGFYRESQNKPPSKGAFWGSAEDARDNVYAGETGGASRFFATFKGDQDEQGNGASFGGSAAVDESGAGSSHEGDSGVPREGMGGGEDGLSDMATGSTPERGTDLGGQNPPRRFNYVAKASRAERNAGLESAPEKYLATMGDGIGEREPNPNEKAAWVKNSHPTVKPIDLMRWLVRLVTPPGGTVLDPFTGSGTTGIAAVLEGFDFIGIEREAEYVEIARARIAWWEQHQGREADEVLAESRRSEAIREQHESAGQMGLEL